MTSGAAPYILALILILLVCFGMLIALICCCLPRGRKRGSKEDQDEDSCCNDDVSVFELESTVIDDHIEGFQWISTSGKTSNTVAGTTSCPSQTGHQQQHQQLEIIVEELSTLLTDPDQQQPTHKEKQ